MNRISKMLLLPLLMGATVLAGCSSPEPNVTERGTIALYEPGEVEFPNISTDVGCAHKTAPAGTELLIEYDILNATCVVNDRGPDSKDTIVGLPLEQWETFAPEGTPTVENATISYHKE